MTNAKIKINLDSIEFKEIVASDIDAKKQIYNLIKKYLPENVSNLLYLFKNQNYDLLIAAYEKNSNKLIGCIAAINKAKLLEIDDVKPVKNDFKTMYIDYVVVNDEYSSNKIGTTLINKVKGFAKENKCIYLSANCPIINSYSKNIYDDNNFNRINVNLLEPKSVEFKKNVSNSVMCYGRLMQGIIAAAKKLNYKNYENFDNDVLKNPDLLNCIAEEIGVSEKVTNKMIGSNIFSEMIPLFKAAINEQKNIYEINFNLNIIKRDKILFSEYSFSEDYFNSEIDQYKTSTYSSTSVNFIGQCSEVMVDINKNNLILLNKNEFFNMNIKNK